MTLYCCAIKRICNFYAILFLFPLSSYALAIDFDGHESEHQQDFLFLLEEGYTQEKGEWQFGLSYQDVSYSGEPNQKKGTDNVWKLGVEYGFTDRFQVEFFLPYQKSSCYQGNVKINTSTAGNPEIELIYQVIQETSVLPVVSIGVGVEIAASSDKAPIRSEEWGYEGFVNASKYLEAWGFLHANLAYGVADKGDETELSYGLGFVRPINDNFSAMIEYLVEREQEDVLQGSNSEVLAQFTVGFSYQNNHGFIAGLAYGQSDNDERLERAFTVKFQYEF
ncbi:hypothetical protein GCM10009111_26800 [Colwellia asteriadis]|uniref:Outer membrane protein beta-barrel domain-containing protein n=1 Tax=Colwellia asteriadis TaxID=517723 RepID=A0ABN1L999_9GAMM